MTSHIQMPLFPLPNVVHFPHTELRLHVFEPRYRTLVRDLLEAREDARWIGMVLLKPFAEEDQEGQPAIFSAGTAGRLVEVDQLPDGRSNICLRGDFRFEVHREFDSQPYRQAFVTAIEEPTINELDPGVLAVRQEIVDTSLSIAAEMGESFPLASDQVEKLASGRGFEEAVNSLAAHLDVPVLRKQQLLSETLPDRALKVLSILRNRQSVLDLLRPYRHLAEGVDVN